MATVFSTVEFGDITTRTDAIGLIVAVQMLLVIIGVVVRLLISTAKTRLG
jgi:hypothetical protein